jgi:hypothetical protein
MQQDKWVSMVMGEVAILYFSGCSSFTALPQEAERGQEA